MSDEDIFKPDELPEEVTLPVSIYYCVDGYDAGKIGAYCFDYNGNAEKIIIHKTTATFKLEKQDNLREKVVDALEEEKKNLMAEHHLKMQKLQDKIDMLLFIEYQPSRDRATNE